MDTTKQKRIPRKAKKGRKYIRMDVPELRLGQIMWSHMAAIFAIIHNSHRRPNTRGSRQYVNIMVRHGLMRRPDTRKLCPEQQDRLRAQIYNDVDSFIRK